MKYTFLIALIFLFSCKKEVSQLPQQSQQNTYHKNLGTDRKPIWQDPQILSARKGGKGHQQASVATQFHFFSIRDTIISVGGVNRLGFIGHLDIPFPAGSTIWDLQHNYSYTDSASAVPAQFTPFLYGYPGSMYTNGVLNFDLNYFVFYDPNSFPGMGISTHYLVGENYTGSAPFEADANWYTTGSGFWQGSYNANGIITH